MSCNLEVSKVKGAGRTTSSSLLKPIDFYLRSAVIVFCAFFSHIHAIIPNASMSSNPNGSGLELEKLPDAPPPKIAVTSPQDGIDAGLRSLDHCQYI